MNRFLSTAAALAALGGAFGSAGCMNSSKSSLQSRYSEKVDPCTSERYSMQAREAALAPFEAHVTNGHVLDQYVQNGDFETGLDGLSPGGRVKLDTLTRKRPVDGHIFLQTARDLVYDASKPADYAKTSTELNAKRANAVVAYLNATTAGRGLAFDVTVIDPAEQLMPASGPANAVRGYPLRFTSGIAGITGVTSTTVAAVGGGASTAAVGQSTTTTYQAPPPTQAPPATPGAPR